MVRSRAELRRVRTRGGFSSNPLIASGASVAFGAPFFLCTASGEVEGECSGVGVSATAGLGVGVSVDFAEAFDFFFFDGLPLGFTAVDSSGTGEADAFRFPCGVGEGEAFLPDAVGDGVSLLVVVFFFFRAGVGVGVEKIFLSVLPIDSSARTGPAIDRIRAVAINARKNITAD